MKPIRFDITKELWERMKAVAKKKGISVSGLVRMVMGEYCEQCERAGK